jgi:anti-sigma B factor antagonist
MAEAKTPLVFFRRKGTISVGTVSASSMISSISIAEFGESVLRYIESHPSVNLLLNFETVDYLSSGVLSELLRINNAIQETKGRLRLCGISKTIREIFEITNLDQIFNIHGEPLEMDLKRFERALEVEAEAAAWEDEDD